MILGFLGTGAITRTIVTGLCSDGLAVETILVSPRNAETASHLAARFDPVSVAASNQDLVDRADTVVIAVRPQIAEGVLSELKFRPDQHIVSVVSGYPVRKLEGLVAPATRIARAVPLPSAALRRSPTAIYPADAAATAMFARMGTVLEVANEPEFDVVCTATATMATYFAIAETIASWLTRHGIPAGKARDYVAHLYAGMSDTTLSEPGRSLRELVADHATRGGTNEQVLKHLTDHHVFDVYSDALDAILVRVTAASRA